MFSKLSLAAGATACSILLLKRDSFHSDLRAAPAISKFELCQVQVIFRHGARTPLYDAPYLSEVSYEQGLMNHSEKTQVNYKLISLHDNKIPRSLLDESYLKRGFLNGGCIRGQLTSIGAEQCYQLGRKLRNRYVMEYNFLSPNFSAMVNEIYVRSTHVARTVASARCVLAGLCNEYGDEPIEIHVTSAEDEVMYPNFHACAKFKQMTRGARTDSDKVNGVAAIKDKVRKKLNLSDDTALNLVAVKDNLLAAQAHEKPFLQEIDSETKQMLDEGAMKILRSNFIGPPELSDQSLKLAIGPFVDVLISNMENFLKNPKHPSAKFHLYSGHDTTLIPLLSAMKVDCNSWPPYASNVVLELYRNTDIKANEEQSYVRVLYNDKEIMFCPISCFKKVCEPVRLPYQKYADLCQPNETQVEN